MNPKRREREEARSLAKGNGKRYGTACKRAGFKSVRVKREALADYR